MKQGKIIYSIILITLITYASCEMRLVFSLFSNGAKSPNKESLNSLNEDMFGERWTHPGEITPVGMRQQYILGLRNRQKYSNFLSPNFDVKEVYIRSIDRNATLSSAEAHLQGLYPQPTGPNLSGYQRNVAYPPQSKTGFSTFNQESFGAPALPYNTQIFPVNTFSEKEYHNMFMYDMASNCKDVWYEIIDNQKKNVTVDWLTNFKNEYGSRLQQAVGFSNTDILLDYTYVHWMMRDFISGFYEGKLHKRLTDAGIDIQDFNSTAVEFLNYNLYEVQNDGKKGLLPNITFGTWAEDMQDWMDKRINLDQDGEVYDEDYTPPKLILYSVDDVVISSFLKYMEEDLNTKVHYVPFASSLYFELIRPDGKDNTALTEYDYFVDIIFNEIPLLTISYAEFKKHLDDAWSKTKIRWECSLSPFEFWGFKNATITLGVLSGVVLILLIIFACLLCSTPQSDDERKLNDDRNKIEVS